MSMLRRFASRTPIVRFALVLALGALSAPIAASAPAQAAPVTAASLGVPSGFKILDGASCGQYMTTEALDSQCDSANANHWIILGWNFDPNGCSAQPCVKPDGFNIVRAVGGARSVFATQPSSSTQTTVFGTILKNIKGDENIGACFSVEPYYGTNIVGRASQEVCIDEVENIELGPTRWATTHAYNDFGGYGVCHSPSSNPAGYGLMFMNNGANSGTSIFAGYVQRTTSCNNYTDVYQGLVYYDLAKLAGKNVAKATLKLQVVQGAYNPGDPNKGDGNERREDINCAASIGFPTNVNVGSDPSFPSVVTFDKFATLNAGIGEVDVDITGMVRAWLHPGGINRGIVLAPALSVDGVYESTNRNLDCLSQYREPVLAVVTQ
jgi:hypothetical protein